jgi:glycine/D-amino acid oxidase-like deaminating enzyme
MSKGAEVVIVGGGIIGCSIAAELARAGSQVLLLERHELASAASGRNHGLIFYPQSRLTGPLYRASEEIYRALQDSNGLDIGLEASPRGFIILVSHESEWGDAEREARASAEGGIEIEELSEQDIKEAEPHVAPGHLGGWLIHDGYIVDPAALTLALAMDARRSGAEIRTHTDVKQILINKRRVTGVATDEGIIESDVVVDAAGPWTAKLARTAGLDLPIHGARGWLLLTRAVAPLANRLLESSGWHVMAGEPGPIEVTVGGFAREEEPLAADVGLLIQQNRSGNVLLGGSRLSSTREDPEGYEVTREIARRAVATVPALAKVPIAGIWSGVRPMTRDGYPLIGWMPEPEGFFVASGHGGQGVILGGGTGRLSAQLIRGEEPFVDPSGFAPGR